MPVDSDSGAPDFDDASWVYLSARASGRASEHALIEKVVEACEQSGWRTISHPPPDQHGVTADPGTHFASVSHAVEHADVVVAVIDGKDEFGDAELTLAFTHGRPVVGVQIGGAPLDTQPKMLLTDYERAKIVTCSSPGECAISLQEAFSDPAFAETIRQAC